MRARKAATPAIRIVAPEVANQPIRNFPDGGAEPPRPVPWASPPALTRRLAAIMAADIVGYTRLMAEDEERTHLALRTIWRRVIAPGIARHEGRVVKHTGDGFLAEFSSALAAVRCAVKFQSAMRARHGETGGRRLLFRVGIHIGDVIVEPHDIFGNSVNLACRLESLAEPGGVLISEAAYASVHASLPWRIEAAGEQALHNVTALTKAFRVEPR